MIDNAIEDLANKLNIQENVVDLVLLTMVRLPDTMPLNFQNNYTPIASPGSQIQKMQLAKLLASQLIELDGNLQNLIHHEELNKKIKTEAMEITSNVGQKSSLHEQYSDNGKENRKNILLRPTLPTTVRTSKSYKLADVTTLLSRKSIDSLMTSAFNRILTFEGRF